MSERIPSPAEPLHRKYPTLHKEAVVEQAAAHRRRAGEKIPNEPTSKLTAWLETLESIHTGHGRSEQRQAAQATVAARIKELYHRPVSEGGYITGTDPHSVDGYLRHQAQIAEQQGHGHADQIMGRASEEVRAEAESTIRSDQERSLDAWLDYLTSDDATYPMWFKYYVFRNITKLASYDKDKGEFPKRSKSTTAPFPDINREALAYMEDSLAKHYGLKPIDPDNPADAIAPETKSLLDKDANFAQLYKRAIEYAAPQHAENLNVTDGQWVHFEQTTDQAKSDELAHSLHGYGTGWCTAGEGMAHSQLSGGDFYVYYTKAEDGQYSVPRVAIRMQEEYGHQRIAEVRGVEADQNMEAALIPIADAKMTEIDPEGAEHYKKASADMARLTEIYNLLEPIRDKETGRVIGFENANAELSPSQLRFLYEIDSKITGFGYGYDPRIRLIHNNRNRRADLSRALDVSADRISFTEEEATSGNSLYHYGKLFLGYLTSAEGLQLPERVDGDLHLSRLTSAEGLQLPERVDGDLHLSRLTSAEGLQLPERVDGDLYLSSLNSAEGLQLPQSMPAGLSLSSLTSAEGLQLPQSVGGNLNLQSLTSAEGLQLPQSVGGSLDLGGLTSAEGLQLPQSVGGSLNLQSLTSAEGLQLPQSVGGSLNLQSLTSAEGLQLPQSVGGSLFLDRLMPVDKRELKFRYPQLARKIR